MWHTRVMFADCRAYQKLHPAANTLAAIASLCLLKDLQACSVLGRSADETALLVNSRLSKGESSLSIERNMSQTVAQQFSTIFANATGAQMRVVKSGVDSFQSAV